MEESGSVFVVIPPSSVTAVRLTHRMPISPTFNHSLNQTPPSPSVSYFHQSSRPRQSTQTFSISLISFIRHYAVIIEWRYSGQSPHIIGQDCSRPYPHHRTSATYRSLPYVTSTSL